MASGSPQSISTSIITTTSVTVNWDAPSATDSEVAKYVVVWNTSTFEDSQEVTETSHKITGLSEGQSYTINVYSLNQDGDRSLTSQMTTFTTCK